LIYWDVASSPLIDIILCTCIDMRLSMSKGLTHGDRPCWDRVMIIIWARGDRPCEWLVMIISWARVDRPCWGLFDVYDSALRSSAQTCGDRLCKYMDLATPLWVMNSRCISEEVSCIYGWVSICHLRHIISWCHIALHLISSFILVDYVFI